MAINKKVRRQKNLRIFSFCPASSAGLSQRKLAEHFLIPYRTMENWCGGVSECPLYTRLMMQRILGLLPEIR